MSTKYTMICYSSHVGTFYFARDDGNNDFAAGFRPVVVPTL